MNTTEVATLLGTTPRAFRQFLRSPISTFVAVGSGARYEFDEADIPTLQKRFSDWNGAGKPKLTPITSLGPKPRRRAMIDARDQKTWDEEEATTGIPELEDIRDPRVRARVLADARAAEDRLMMRLMAAGMHVTQAAIRRVVA